MTPLKAAVERVEDAVSTLQKAGMTGYPPIADLRLIFAALAEREWREIAKDPPPEGTLLITGRGQRIFPTCWARDGSIVEEFGDQERLIVPTHWMAYPDGPEQPAKESTNG